METEWMARGNCHNMPPEVFFPRDEAEIEEVLAICQGCSVREPCLEYAVEHNIVYGVWGGMSEADRRRLVAASKGVKRLLRPRLGAA